MSAFRVLTGTVSFGRRLELELGRVESETLEGAARIVARDYAHGVEGFRDPWPVAVEGVAA